MFLKHIIFLALLVHRTPLEKIYGRKGFCYRRQAANLEGKNHRAVAEQAHARPAEFF